MTNCMSQNLARLTFIILLSSLNTGLSSAEIPMPSNKNWLFYCADKVGPTGQCASGWRQIASCVAMTFDNETCRGKITKVSLCPQSAGQGKTTCFVDTYTMPICQARLGYDPRCLAPNSAQPSYNNPTYQYRSGTRYFRVRPNNFRQY